MAVAGGKTSAGSKTVAATGFFDGVHIGHRAVIETLVREARKRGDESLILTFWPHPRLVLGSLPGPGPRQPLCSLQSPEPVLLDTLEEKKARLLSLGVDRVEVIPFTREFASLTALDYLVRIQRDYGVDCLVLGYDSHIGSDRQGPDQIASLCRTLGLDCLSVPPVEISLPTAPAGGDASAAAAGPAGGDASAAAAAGPAGGANGKLTVSSTLIRAALAEGNTELAARMLGRG